MVSNEEERPFTFFTFGVLLKSLLPYPMHGEVNLTCQTREHVYGCGSNDKPSPIHLNDGQT